MARSSLPFRRHRRRASGGSGNDDNPFGIPGVDAGDAGSPGGSDGGAIDPESIAASGDASGDGDGGDAPRKRGWPKGKPRGPRSDGSSGKGAKGAAADIAGIEKTLLSIHTMAAAFFSAPEWELEQSEAHAIAAAAKEVSRHYDVPGISPEHAAIGMLLIAVGSAYIPRAVITYQRRRGNKSGPRPVTSNTPAADETTAEGAFNAGGLFNINLSAPPH